MSAPVVNPLDVAFVLSVTGVAWVFPPAALIVGAAYFLLSFYLTYKTPEAPK